MIGKTISHYKIIEKIGAGLIHGLLKGWDIKQVLEFAVAASALKQTISGEMNLVN